MKKLIIIGASGHGKVVADIAQKTRRYREICFLDDNPEMKECMGFPVIGKVNSFTNWKSEADYIVAIGNSHIREQIINQLWKKRADVTTLIHPNACIGMHVEIGEGTVVMAGVVINSNTKIGHGVIINTASSLDHDNVIGDYCHISVGAHLAGNVQVENHTWVGAGAIISNNVNICESCTIGAGAVVVKNIDESGTYVGIPAKRIT